MSSLEIVGAVNRLKGVREQVLIVHDYVFAQSYATATISSRNYLLRLLLEQLVFESGVYKLGMEDEEIRNPLPQARWSGCRHQGVNPKRHCLVSIHHITSCSLNFELRPSGVCVCV